MLIVIGIVTLAFVCALVIPGINVELLGYIGRLIQVIFHITDLAPNPKLSSGQHMSEEKYVQKFVELLDQLGDEIPLELRYYSSYHMSQASQVEKLLYTSKRLQSLDSIISSGFFASLNTYLITPLLSFDFRASKETEARLLYQSKKSSYVKGISHRRVDSINLHTSPLTKQPRPPTTEKILKNVSENEGFSFGAATLSFNALAVDSKISASSIQGTNENRIKSNSGATTSQISQGLDLPEDYIPSTPTEPMTPKRSEKLVQAVRNVSASVSGIFRSKSRTNTPNATPYTSHPTPPLQSLPAHSQPKDSEQVERSAEILDYLDNAEDTDVNIQNIFKMASTSASSNLLKLPRPPTPDAEITFPVSPSNKNASLNKTQEVDQSSTSTKQSIYDVLREKFIDYALTFFPDLTEVDITKGIPIGLLNDIDDSRRKALSYPCSKCSRMSKEVCQCLHLSNIEWKDINTENSQEQLAVIPWAKLYFDVGKTDATIPIIRIGLWEFTLASISFLVAGKRKELKKICPASIEIKSKTCFSMVVSGQIFDFTLPSSSIRDELVAGLNELLSAAHQNQLL